MSSVSPAVSAALLADVDGDEVHSQITPRVSDWLVDALWKGHHAISGSATNVSADLLQILSQPNITTTCCCRYTAAEADDVYQSAPLSYNKNTNNQYTGILKVFEVSCKRHPAPDMEQVAATSPHVTLTGQSFCLSLHYVCSGGVSTSQGAQQTHSSQAPKHAPKASASHPDCSGQ